jgi:uncharacterized protein
VTSTATCDLLDVNVWLALAHVQHPHHEAAKQYWVGATVPLAFCRTSMQGFLRLVTQAKVMGDAAHTPLEAWGIYTAHLASGRSVFLPEPDGLDAVWQRLSASQNFHIRDWTDAYLASFAIQAHCRMVSFDAGFAKYQKPDVGLDFLHLKPGLMAQTKNAN